ncbi:MAG: hypothetical protein HYR91_13780 [Flavobacteriia bacterium]|nr:hypothetical protein [Flavobacteriia bacterium]
MKKIALLCLILISLVMINSCKKEEGYGGNCAISGVLKMKTFTQNFSQFQSEKVVADEYVYIQFQEGKGYGDRVKTAYDGSFSFTHLKIGTYKIYAYSEDSTLISQDKVAIMKEVKITKSKQLIQLDEGIIIKTNTNVLDESKVTGKVIAHKNGITYTAMNEKVFLVLQGEDTYTKFVYTDNEGNYKFDKIPNGVHQVYVYSKNGVDDPNGPFSPIIQNFTIVNTNEFLQLPVFNINK